MVRVQNYKAMLGESGQPYEVGKRLDCSVRCRLSFPRLSGFVNRDAAPVLIFIGTTRAIVGARVHLRPMPVVFPVVRKSIVTFLLVLFTSMAQWGRACFHRLISRRSSICQPKKSSRWLRCRSVAAVCLCWFRPLDLRGNSGELTLWACLALALIQLPR